MIHFEDLKKAFIDNLDASYEHVGCGGGGGGVDPREIKVVLIDSNFTTLPILYLLQVLARDPFFELIIK